MSNDISSKDSTGDKPAKAWYLRPRVIAIVFVSVVFLVLILQNMDSVMVQVLFWKVSAPAALLYIFFAGAGFGAARITINHKPRGPKS